MGINLTATDADGDDLIYSIVSAPVNGQITGDDGDAHISYAPDSGFSGTDTFSFKANDGLDDSEAAFVTVTVNSTPSAEPTVTLAASPSTVSVGGTVTLAWDFSNAENGYIDQGIGTLPSTSGAIDVAPEHTTTYTVSVFGPNGVAKDQVMVKVLGDPAPLPEDSFGKKYEDIIPEDATVEEYDSDRFSLVTGRVKGVDEQWLQGVTVSAFGHIEYGTATTDIEGFFSLPVESDGRMTFVFQKDGMIETRRSVDVPWNGYAVTETVVMVAEDTKSTKVVFDGDPTTTITHQSTVVADEFGSRSCTMVFSGDNKAYLTDEDGNDIGELPAVTVRATEFTTLDSMPAVLPPNSAYTYCAELAADGVQRIRFEKPVAVWVDNFLGFPVGTVVPSGYYDRDKGIWISADSGAVVKLLDTDGDGKADAFDSDGDESADGNVAGLDDPVQYAPGKIFWRVEVSHFTPWDLNWGIWPPSDAGGPNPYGEPGGDEQRGSGGVGGGGIGGGPCGNPPSDRRHFNSYIQQRSRVFHEDIPVPGTDITLHYASNRASGYKAVITVPASGEELPGSLKRIDVIARVAGREFREEFPPLPNQKAEFIWDGTDFLGRTVAGSVSVHTEVGFVYDAVYQYTRRFGYRGNGTAITGDRARQEVTLWKKQTFFLANKGENSIAEGWALSPHHFLSRGVLFKGDGGIENGLPGKIDTLTTFDGNTYSTALDGTGGVFVGAGRKVYRVDREGAKTLVAGNGNSGYDGDGGPATEARLTNPRGLAADPWGNLYISDASNHCVRKVDSGTGAITTVAGTGASGYSGDDGPATLAQLNSPQGITVDEGGNLYIADSGNDRIRRVDPNGVISTVAGGGELEGEDIPATEALLRSPSSVATDTNGNIYIAAFYGYWSWVSHDQILKVDSAGTISTVISSAQTDLGAIHGITVDPQGNLYLAGNYSYDYGYNHGTYNHFVRILTPAGDLSVLAGKRRDPSNNYSNDGYTGDGGPATEAKMNKPLAVSVDGDGTLFIADSGNQCVRRVSPSSIRGDTYFVG